MRSPPARWSIHDCSAACVADISPETLQAGKDLATIQKEGLPEEWKEWGSGFINTERWIGAVHESLQGNQHAHPNGEGTHH